jgi:hypothetical protein
MDVDTLMISRVVMGYLVTGLCGFDTCEDL